jgi:hypothetical protein
VEFETLVALACDFAEHTLSFYDNKFNDNRPRAAIEAARKYVKFQSIRFGGEY